MHLLISGTFYACKILFHTRIEKCFLWHYIETETPLDKWLKQNKEKREIRIMDGFLNFLSVFTNINGFYFIYLFLMRFI